MTETLSIRIDSETKQRLAAEAIAAYVKTEAWQIGEIHEAIEEMDSGQSVSHEKVRRWLESWGAAGESKAPR